MPPATPTPPTAATSSTVAVVGASTIVGLMPGSQTLRIEMQVYSGLVNCYQRVFQAGWCDDFVGPKSW